MADFNADSTNKNQDNRSFQGAGVKAGVEDGLSMVEKLPRGATQAEQQFHGANQRKDHVSESAGSKNGKSFTFSQ